MTSLFNTLTNCIFFLMRKFFPLHLDYFPVNQDTERFHQIGRQIKLIKHIIMKESELCNYNARYNFSRKRRQQMLYP